MFISKGNEVEDTETAGKAGILNPRFGSADWWFTLHAEDGYLVLKDGGAGL